MHGRRLSLAGAAVAAMAAAALMAGPALASSDGVTVGSIGSLKAGATAATLSGKVVNRTNHEAAAKVTVRINRYGTKAQVVGATAVNVAGNSSAAYKVGVKLPAGLKKGNYYLSACTPSGAGDGGLGCGESGAR